MRKLFLAASLIATGYTAWVGFQQFKVKKLSTERVRGKEAVADWENEGGAVKGMPSTDRK